MTTRDEFEKWVISLDGDFVAFDFTRRNEFDRDRYSSDSLQFAWQAWEAAQMSQWQPIETAPKENLVFVDLAYWPVSSGDGRDEVLYTGLGSYESEDGRWYLWNSDEPIIAQFWRPHDAPKWRSDISHGQ